jgi:hypothetical protein
MVALSVCTSLHKHFSCLNVKVVRVEVGMEAPAITVAGSSRWRSGTHYDVALNGAMPVPPGIAHASPPWQVIDQYQIDFREVRSSTKSQ